MAGTRFVDMPLYRLTDIRVGKGEIGGSLGITPFASYALTLDLLEGELADYAAWGPGIDHSWEAITDSVVITVRWPSASA